MSFSTRRATRSVALVLPWLAGSAVMMAQTNSGSINGTVLDPAGAAVVGATINIQNPASGFVRTTVSGDQGQFDFFNVPLSSYHVTAMAKGFGGVATDADVRSSVPVNLKIALLLSGAASTVTVDGSDLLHAGTSAETNLDRDSFKRVPVESPSSSLSSLVTLTTPGVTADSNGLFHGLGDHASNAFYVDGQPITDQQSKVFSNQIPVNAIQTIQAIEGAPPAQYGDKTSLVIDVTTRSGQGVAKPTGDAETSYGSFGSSTGLFDLAYGGKNWGNFISFDGLNTGRFLDGPEFSIFHDKGNEENAFDRADYQLTPQDSLHLDLNYSRSWFQTPNAYDNLNVQNVVSTSSGTSAAPAFSDVGDTDQKSKIETFNIAPFYQKVIGSDAVFNLGLYARKDAFHYYGSSNPLADLGPPSLQREAVSQERTLLNTGAHSDIDYSVGVHDIKAGSMYEQTFLRENFNLGIVDPVLNAPCVNGNGQGLAGFTDPGQCAGAGLQPNTAANPNAPNSVYYPNYNPVLAPYDLTRGGSSYAFHGRTDVKELGLYLEDQIKARNWLVNAGIRGDFYNGLVTTRQVEPRLGLGYSVKQTNTVLRAVYARSLETPFNENLVVSSIGAENPVISALIPSAPARVQPGFRNAFHAGFQQAAGRYLVVDADYVWVYTHNAFDFSILGNTPIFFPIDWHNSKISGPVVRVTLPSYHHLTAFTVFSSVNARFFTPQVAGLGTVPATVNSGVPTAFRIDHDERFNQTTNFQYQPFVRLPWFAFNWRYDSGLVAGSVPCYADTATCGPSSTTLNGQPAVQMVSNNVPGVPLTADQEAQAGFECNGQKATPTQPLPFTCLASEFTSSLVRIPKPGTENDDHNPQRIQPRNLFDMSLGQDNLFKGTQYRWSAQVTAVNVANKYALYNYLSTFSGTHYVTPRSVVAEVGFHF